MGVMVKQGDAGAAVEDVQRRLSLIGMLDESCIDGVFGDDTAAAVEAFCERVELPLTQQVTTKVWAALVDASFFLGDRTLYLRMPYFHGHDVKKLQQALGAMGFSCGGIDGIFGATTETALRQFQMNMGLPTDGIAGAYTFDTIRRLHFSWEDKDIVSQDVAVGYTRAADVLERNALCLFGTHEFTRSVASRMSNLAVATNPASRITSADSLLVAPDPDMLRVHLLLPEQARSDLPVVLYEEGAALPRRLRVAFGGLHVRGGTRLAIQLPGTMWEDAGEERSAQHFAITLLDAFCAAL